VVRVRVADAQPFASSRTEAIAGRLNRINDVAKPLALVDQRGRTVTLEQFRGRPVIVTFAYAHCETVCPLVVNDALGARDQLAGHAPVVLIVTLDPWRDTPSRLASIAERWGVTGDAHVLSGAPEQVERVLNAWRIPRARNERTGDLSHPSLVYVVGADGRIAYVVSGSQSVIRAAVEAL
jgi:protein SCO1